MNLLLYDPELGSFLDKLVLLPNDNLKKLKFRNLNYNNNDKIVDKSDASPNSCSFSKNLSNNKNILNQNRRSQHKNCNKCYICKLELNLNEISHIICKLVNLGIRKLMVYLVLSNKKYLYSTITLNYVRCLYSRVIMNYEYYFNDLNVINHNKIDITILPLYNYQKLLNNDITIFNIYLNNESNYDLPVDNDNNFIYLNNKFMFKELYNHKLNLNKKDYEANDREDKEENQDKDKNKGYQDNTVVLDEFDCMSDNSTETQNPEDIKETNSDEKVNLLWLKSYDNIMFCGTFDYLHFGHKLLLLSAFLLFKKKLHIGVVASKAMLSNKYNHSSIQPLETRKSYLKYYLSYLLNIYGSESVDHNTNTNNNTNNVSNNNNINKNNNNLTEENDREDGDKSNVSEQKLYRYTSIDFNMDTDNDNENKNIDNNSNNMDLKDDLNNDTYNFSNVDNCDSIKIFDLFDVIGPSCELQDKFGLLLTPEIIHNGIEVNKLRKKLNLVPWDLIIVGLVCYQSDSKLIKLSSSTIRKLV